MSQPGVGRRKWLRQRPIFSRRAALQLLEQKIVLTIIIAMPARRKEPRSPTTGDVKTFTPFDTRQKTNNRPRTCKLNKNPHNNFDSMLSSHAKEHPESRACRIFYNHFSWLYCRTFLTCRRAFMISFMPFNSRERRDEADKILHATSLTS